MGKKRVNFGKKRSFLKFKKSKKNPIPSHTEKSFTISILKKKKSPTTTTTYWLCLSSLPNSTLSVFKKKQQKNTFYLIYTVCFFGHYTTIPYLQSPISQVFSTILYYSPEKKIMF